MKKWEVERDISRSFGNRLLGLGLVSAGATALCNIDGNALLNKPWYYIATEGKAAGVEFMHYDPMLLLFGSVAVLLGLMGIYSEKGHNEDGGKVALRSAEPNT